MQDTGVCFPGMYWEDGAQALAALAWPAPSSTLPSPRPACRLKPLFSSCWSCRSPCCSGTRGNIRHHAAVFSAPGRTVSSSESPNLPRQLLPPAGASRRISPVEPRGDRRRVCVLRREAAAAGRDRRGRGVGAKDPG